MCGVVSILIIIQKLLARWGFSGHSLEHGTVWKIFLKRLTPTQLDILYSSSKWKFSLSLPMWIAFHVNFITLTWPNISGRQENWGWDVSTVVTRVLTVGGTRYWLYTSSFIIDVVVSYLHQRNRLGNSSTILWTAWYL